MLLEPADDVEMEADVTVVVGACVDGEDEVTEIPTTPELFTVLPRLLLFNALVPLLLLLDLQLLLLPLTILFNLQPKLFGSSTFTSTTHLTFMFSLSKPAIVEPIFLLLSLLAVEAEVACGTVDDAVEVAEDEPDDDSAAEFVVQVAVAVVKHAALVTGCAFCTRGVPGVLELCVCRIDRLVLFVRLDRDVPPDLVLQVIKKETKYYLKYPMQFKRIVRECQEKG